ncbi:unnamed protein product [Calypogeia fissa]
MEANIAAALAISKEKELLLQKEREREKEKEREGEMEAALYSNCLLLGLDAAVLGNNVGNRVGLFKHSNPRVGEALLHFLLSALRGPSLSAKDFAGVWPIFDAAQSRDFRKIVQNLINELEAQGALPRSNSRVSSLATCCGQRFVELLWQLSAHTLREVHKRSFPSDVAANPLPASLTEIVSQNSHAASLLPVTKARIALERKRFVEGASAAVRRQALWSSLANDLTAEFRALCAEEAFLQQELEKMQDLQDVQDLQDWQARKSGGASFGASGYTIDEEVMSVERASVLWESLLHHAEQHEKLASGPVEDLISHREHRYRIDGSALRSAINRGSSAVPVDTSLEDLSQRFTNDDESSQRPGSSDGSRLETSSIPDRDVIDESRGRVDERSSKVTSQLDVAEIIRRWTHALHRLHKQALRLARANDGAGPDLLKDATGDTDNGHAQAVQATVAEHRQHLANMQTLVTQLKDSIPGMEAAVAALRDQVNSSDMVKACLDAQSALSSPLPHETRHHLNREGEAPVDGDEVIYGLRPLELVPPSPALKLPQLLSTSPSSLEKIARLQKRFNSFSHMFPLESLREEDVRSRATSIAESLFEDGSDAGEESIMSLRQTLREAALSQPAPTPELPNERSHPTVAEHYFTPVVQPSNNKIFEDKKVDVVFGKQRSYSTSIPNRSLSSHPSMDMTWNATEDLKGSPKKDSTKVTDRPSSPPLLMDLSSFGDAYDDLLAPMSELDMLN